MTRKRSIALKLFGRSHSDLKSFSFGIYEGFVNHAATYSSPVVSLADQLSANNEFQNALNEYGVTGHRGGKKAYQRLIDASEAVRGNLKQLANYCEAQTPDDVTKWMDVGFVPKEVGEKVGIPAQPGGVTQVHRPKDMPGTVHLVWNKPLGTIRRRTVIYKVMRSSTDNYANAAELGITTKRFFIDEPPQQGVVYYYWIVPINGHGDGVVSPLCMALAQITITHHA